MAALAHNSLRYMIGDSTRNHQIAEHFKDVLAIEASSDLDREAFARELVDHRKHTELANVAGPVLNEIIRPYVIAMHWPQPHARGVILP